MRKSGKCKEKFNQKNERENKCEKYPYIAMLSPPSCAHARRTWNSSLLSLAYPSTVSFVCGTSPPAPLPLPIPPHTPPQCRSFSLSRTSLFPIKWTGDLPRQGRPRLHQVGSLSHIFPWHNFSSGMRSSGSDVCFFYGIFTIFSDFFQSRMFCTGANDMFLNIWDINGRILLRCVLYSQRSRL